MVSRTRVLVKREEIPSGHDPKNYVTRRLFAKAEDGESVPITLLHRADFSPGAGAPLLLYGYGAYGDALSASFDSNALSLVDRGLVYALAHVRGGVDKGWSWYENGKLEHKTNSFTDFIACARQLIGAGYTFEGAIIAQGASAGGMLMGAVANMAPELFAGIVAGVPFVDVLNTMLRDDLPLTPPEWLEWGNPIADSAAFDRLAAYSPYDNVTAQNYPPILAMAGLTDPRVTYWEPLKWVQRLRATTTGGGPILLRTQMGAGHAGASGRFEQLDDTAVEYAFALACAARAIQAERS
jgi:oligopeptidase B